MVTSTSKHALPGHTLPPTMVAALLQTVLRTWHNGDHAGARTLIRVVARQYPNQPGVWMLLATIAETPTEQNHALEQLLMLDQPPLSQRRPRHTMPARVEPLAPAPELVPTHRSPGLSPRIVLYTLVAAAAGASIGAVALGWAQVMGPAQPTTPTPSLVLLESPVPTDEGPLPSVAPPPTRVQIQQPTQPPATQQPVTTPTPPPPSVTAPINPSLTSTPHQMLKPGQLLTYQHWHATVLAAHHALPLDGSIGTIAPRGRFFLTLVTIGNNGTEAVFMPLNLFRIVDQQGKRYIPLPKVSTAYLNVYGRGLRGDLSQEDPIPAGGGNVSVPLIFDLPIRVRGLTLYFGDSVIGWPIDDGADR